MRPPVDEHRSRAADSLADLTPRLADPSARAGRSAGSVTDAASTLGNARPSAFAGMFRKQVGTPPSTVGGERRQS